MPVNNCLLPMSITAFLRWAVPAVYILAFIGLTILRQLMGCKVRYKCCQSQKCYFLLFSSKPVLWLAVVSQESKQNLFIFVYLAITWMIQLPQNILFCLCLKTTLKKLKNSSIAKLPVKRFSLVYIIHADLCFFLDNFKWKNYVQS